MTTLEKVMKLKKKDNRKKGVGNNLVDDEIGTIAATVVYFGGIAQQAVFDLGTAQYRVYDFLAMCINTDRVGSEDATKVLVYSFLKANGDIDKWIQDLRETDYAVVTDWKEVEL